MEAGRAVPTKCNTYMRVFLMEVMMMMGGELRVGTPSWVAADPGTDGRMDTGSTTV